MKGYTSRFIYIDLNEKKSKILSFGKNFAQKFIGGRGFGAKIIHDHVSSNKIQGLDPDNLIIMATGPLTGVLAPGSAKTSFSFISPATNIYGDSNIGSHIGFELKKAGYDFLVIKGKSESPTLINIVDNEISFQDARNYWGKNTFQAAEEIKKDSGLYKSAVATIGPAGEKLLTIASVQSENRFAGRAGLGAVFGSKNLKAILISGSNDIHVANYPELIKTFKETNNFFQNHPNSEYFQKFGTYGLLEGVNEHGIMPINNFSEGFVENLGTITVEGYMATVKRQVTQTCLYCPIACEGVFQNKGETRIRPQYETLAMLGPNIGIYDLDFVVEANNIANEIGADTISLGNLIGLMMEAYEKNLIPKQYYDGFELTFGNQEGVRILIDKMVKREGIGEVVANGMRGILEKFPKLESIALHSKYLEQSGYDTRSLYGQCLGYATSDVGAHHNRAWTAYHELKVENSDSDLANLVIYHQHVRPLMDCLGVCRFPWIEFDIDLTYYEQFYEHATGFKATIAELLKRSEGIYNLTRLINTSRGLRRKDDYPPLKSRTEPIPNGPNKGKKIDMKRYENILSLYYAKRNWDDQGIPKPEHVKALGILDNEISLPKF